MKARLEEVAHMEKLSRVKKYEELRKSIEMDNNINALNNSTELQNSENLLQSFDSSITKQQNSLNDAIRAKRVKSQTQDEDVNDIPTTDTFTNEYLDDFIKEVRDYNIRKGNRESEDTEVDILYQLNAANRVKRAQYVSEIQEDTKEDTKETQDIANEVKNLLAQDDNEKAEEVNDTFTLDSATHVENPNQDTVELISSFLKNKPREEVVEQTSQRDGSSDTLEVRMPKDVRKPKEEAKPKVEKKPKELKLLKEGIKRNPAKKLMELKKPSHQKFYEETQKIKVQLDECENEISDLSQDVSKNNKLLNYLLIILTFILLVIIGFFAYKIIQVGGY